MLFVETSAKTGVNVEKVLLSHFQLNKIQDFCNTGRRNL